MIRHLPDFQCKLCERVVDMRWYGRGRDTPLAPICFSCEREYREGHGTPTGGSFRDRREVMRGFAVAEYLHCAAARMQWETKHAA